MGWTALLAASSAGSGLLSAFSQFQQGQVASEAGRIQATEYREQAQEAEFSGGQQIAANDYRASHILSAIQARTGASGITSEGSPSVEYSSSAEEAQINDMYTKYAANVQSTNLQYQGTLAEWEGNQQEQANTEGAITGAISGGIQAFGIGSGKMSPSSGFGTP